MSNGIALGLCGVGIMAVMALGITSRSEASADATLYNAPYAAPVVATFVTEAERQQPEASAYYFDGYKLTKEEFTLAATMWGEARGEGKMGMGYVGHVIMNRAEAGFRGDTVIKVARKHKQFSCWNHNDPNREKLNLAYLENSSGVERQRWEEAKRLAYYILRGSKDYTGGALHYHTTAINPKWSKDYAVTTVRGNHVFYR